MENLVKENLIKFAQEMREWEIYCNKIEERDYSDKKINTLQKSRLESIFSKYCTKKKRLQGRIENINYGCDGSFDYNPESYKFIEIVCQEGKGHVIVMDMISETKYLFKYKIVKSQILFDSKMFFSSWRNKWLKYSL